MRALWIKSALWLTAILCADFVYGASLPQPTILKDQRILPPSSIQPIIEANKNRYYNDYKNSRTYTSNIVSPNQPLKKQNFQSFPIKQYYSTNSNQNKYINHYPPHTHKKILNKQFNSNPYLYYAAYLYNNSILPNLKYPQNVQHSNVAFHNPPKHTKYQQITKINSNSTKYNFNKNLQPVKLNQLHKIHGSQILDKQINLNKKFQPNTDYPKTHNENLQSVKYNQFPIKKNNTNKIKPKSSSKYVRKKKKQKLNENNLQRRILDVSNNNEDNNIVDEQKNKRKENIKYTNKKKTKSKNVIKKNNTLKHKTKKKVKKKKKIGQTKLKTKINTNKNDTHSNVLNQTLPLILSQAKNSSKLDSNKNQSSFEKSLTVTKIKYEYNYSSNTSTSHIKKYKNIYRRIKVSKTPENETISKILRKKYETHYVNKNMTLQKNNTFKKDKNIIVGLGTQNVTSKFDNKTEVIKKLGPEEKIVKHRTKRSQWESQVNSTNRNRSSHLRNKTNSYRNKTQPLHNTNVTVQVLRRFKNNNFTNKHPSLSNVSAISSNRRITQAKNKFNNHEEILLNNSNHYNPNRIPKLISSKANTTGLYSSKYSDVKTMQAMNQPLLNFAISTSPKKPVIHKVVTKWSDSPDLDSITSNWYLNNNNFKDQLSFHDLKPANQGNNNGEPIVINDKHDPSNRPQDVTINHHGSNTYDDTVHYTTQTPKPPGNKFGQNSHSTVSSKRPLVSHDLFDRPSINKPLSQNNYHDGTVHINSIPSKYSSVPLQVVSPQITFDTNIPDDVNSNDEDYKDNADNDSIADADECPTVFLTINNTVNSEAKEGCADIHLIINSNVETSNIITSDPSIQDDPFEDAADESGQSFPLAAFPVPPVPVAVPASAPQAASAALISPLVPAALSSAAGLAADSSPASSSLAAATLAGVPAGIPAGIPPIIPPPLGGGAPPSNAVGGNRPKPDDDDDDMFGLTSWVSSAAGMFSWLTFLSPLNYGMLSLFFAPIAIFAVGGVSLAALMTPWSLPGIFERKSKKVVFIEEKPSWNWNWDPYQKTWKWASLKDPREIPEESGVSNLVKSIKDKLTNFVEYVRNIRYVHYIKSFLLEVNKHRRNLKRGNWKKRRKRRMTNGH